MTSQSFQRTRTRRSPVLTRVAALAGAAALAVSGCADDDDGSAGPEVSTDVGDIAEAGDADGTLGDPFLGPLVGEEVTVSGEIIAYGDGRVFEIAGEESSVLVVYEPGLAESVDADALVQVTGTVRQLLVDTFAADFGLAYDPSVYSSFVNRPAIDADEVVVLEGDEDVVSGGDDADNVPLEPLNDSGVEGDAALVLDGTTLSVTLSAQDLSAGQPHAMHIHHEAGRPSECPDDGFDADGDGLLTTAEGVPAYGGVVVALTTEGDFGADSGLAVERFPTADDDGRLEFERTFELDAETAEMLRGAQVAVVLHGQDLDGSGSYDGDAESSLDPSLPLEATLPVACGVGTLA